MKLKTLGRLAGAYNSLVGSLVVGASSYVLTKINYDLLSIFSSDLSLSSKIGVAGTCLFFGMYVPLGSLIIADGVTDTIKGTHHYFSCRLWQRLTKNPKTREKIQRDLEAQLMAIEE